MPVARAWQAPLPHGGKLEALQSWWSQFDDPLVPGLIESAQQANASIARAASSIADARAASVAGDAARLPTLNAVASGNRGRPELSGSVANTASVGLQASWELDLFGAHRAGADAAHARLQASETSWHDARVSVAAEVVRNYVELRACEAQLMQAGLDATSREQTSRLTTRAEHAGLRAPAAAALARASAAEGKAAVLQQREQCDLRVKALVALTARDEADLRRDFAAQAARLPRPAGFTVGSVPATVLAQRPDLRAAALDVSAASAMQQQADAQRWPRITLSGSIGSAHVSSLGVSDQGTTWSVGPVAIVFPLFDGSMRKANARAARVHYDTARTVYASRIRDAIQEVESAFVTLDSSTKRAEHARAARDGYGRAFQASAASYRAGTASLFELEDARRMLLSSQVALIDLERERLLAWVALYRATGGGWPTDDAADRGTRQGDTEGDTGDDASPPHHISHTPAALARARNP